MTTEGFISQYLLHEKNVQFKKLQNANLNSKSL